MGADNGHTTTKIGGKLKEWISKSSKLATILLALYGVLSLFTKSTFTEARIDYSATLIDTSMGTETAYSWLSLLSTTLTTDQRSQVYDAMVKRLKEMGESTDSVSQLIIDKASFASNADKPILRDRKGDVHTPGVRRVMLAFYLGNFDVQQSSFLKSAIPPTTLLVITLKNVGRSDAEKFHVNFNTKGRIREVFAISDTVQPTRDKTTHTVLVSMSELAPGTTCSIGIWLDADSKENDSPVFATCSWKDHSLRIEPTKLVPPSLAGADEGER